MGPQTLLFFTSLLILGSVVSQTLNYCPPQAFFDPTFSVVCSSFGTGHIHTWDGTAYDFHEYGDFFLVTDTGSSGFSIQVRQVDCQTTKSLAIPITTMTQYSATCVQSYVITTIHGTVEFSHQLNNDYLNVTVNGVSRPPQASDSVGGASWQVIPYYYTNPYKAWQRDSLAFMPDADFHVIFNGSPVSMNIKFFSSGYSSIILGSTLPGVQGWGGLCGFADGCAANDLAIAEVPLEPLPNIDASKFLATSDGANAGLLPAPRQFVNNTKDPNSWTPYFGSSWRVSLADSEFTTPSGDKFNIRLIKTNYPAPQTKCDWPAGWDIPSFIADACAEDNAASSDPDGFDQFAAKTLWFDYCTVYCSQGLFPFRNPTLQPSQCNGYCEYPKGVNPDAQLHANYNNVTFPPYWLQYSTESLALFTSQLSLGGTYTFNLATNDSCEARTYNVTRSIKCTNTLSVDAFQATPSTFVERNHWYNYPRVCIVANVPSRLVRASWMFMAWPGTPTDQPFLSDPLSFNPCFYPVLPGSYTLEQAVYDGCQIKKQNLTIVAECSSCPSASIIGLQPVKEIMWGLDFNSASTGVSRSTTPTYPPKTLLAGSQSQDWPTYAALAYHWSVSNDDDSRDIIVSIPGNPNYVVFRYPDGSVNEFAMMHPDGVLTNTTMGAWSTPVSVGASYTLAGFVLPPLKGPVGTTYGVYPPQREFAILRAFTVEQIVNITESTANNVTYIHEAAPPVPRCTLSFGAADQNQSMSTLTATSAYPASQWDYGSGCVGEYNVQLQVAEAFCKNATDVQKVVVECGPQPEVFVGCVQTAQYNYATRSFPPVTIDASRTVDVYARPLTLLYTVIPPPASITANTSINPATCRTPGCTSLTPSFTPDVDGTYLIQVQASTSCNSSAVNTSVVGWCNGTSSQVVASWQTVATGPFYYDGSALSMQISLTAAASTTGAPGSFPTYEWSVIYTPPNGLVPAPIFNNPTAATPILNVVGNGAYQVNLRVSQGCNQFSWNNQTVNFGCDAIITAAIAEGPGPINVPYPWIATTLTSSSTFTWQTHPAAGVGINNWVLHQGNTTTPLGSGPTQILPAPTYGVVPGTQSYVVELISTDGCQYSNTSVQVNYQCYPLVISIAALQPTYPTATTITLDGSGTNAPGVGTTYQWIVTSLPADLQGPPPTINTPFQPIATFTPLWGGSYSVVLIVTDGCSVVNQTVTFTVTCLPGGFSFTPIANPASLVWNENAFKQVALAATFPAKSATATYVYTWRVMSAPNLSIFYPNLTFTSTTVNTTVSTVIPDGSYQYVLYNTTFTQTNITVQNYTVLANSANDPQSIFPSCFFPDLAGTYQLELWARDTCQAAVATQRLTVTTQCAASPTIALQVTEHADFNSSVESRYVNASGSNLWRVSLSRAAPRRVVLDARGTTAPSNSRLTYYWAWGAPDPRYNTTWAQDQIETPYSSTAAVLLNRAGDYHLSLVVHDGCSWNILNFTLTAACAEPQPTLTTSATQNLDGSQYYTFALAFAQTDNQTLCSSNQWQMINFSATVGSNNASHSVASLPLLFALLASLFTLLRV